MGDEQLGLPSPLSDAIELTASSPTDAQAGLDDVTTIVEDCVRIVAEVEDNVTKDVQDCLNSCNGDIGLCKACVLGDISDYINRSGLAVTTCGGKVVSAVNSAMMAAWQSAAALGVPMPTPAQINAAIAGEPIPDVEPPQTVSVTDGGEPFAATTGTTSVGVTDDGNTVTIGGVRVPIVIGVNGGATDGTTTLTPGVNAPYPTAILECIPNTWGPGELLQWLVANYGNNVQVITMPGANRVGSASINGFIAPIPNFCAVAPPTAPPPPIDRPTPPPVTNPPSGTGSGGPIAPGQNPLPGGGISVPAGTPFAPPGPIVMPDGSRCQCPAAYGSGHRALPTDARIQDDGSVDCYVRDWLGTDELGNDVYGDWTYYSSVCNQPTDKPPVGPPPPTPPVEPPPGPPKEPIHFGTGDVCSPDSILGAASRLDGFLREPGTGTTDAAEALGGLSGALIAGAASSLAGVSLGSFQPLISLLGIAAGVENAEFIRQVIEPPVPPGDCHSPAFFLTAFARILPKLFGGWFGAVPDQTQRQWDYSINYLCQNTIPSQAELNQLANRGYTRIDSWEVATKMLGNCVPWQEAVRELSHSRIGIADAFRLFKLGKIENDEWEKQWKRQGIDVNKEKELWQLAIQQYPQMADLIRMMVRDVADEATVSKLGLDGIGESAFENKWAGILKDWGVSQGVSDAVARFYYRAHWQNPAPTQIYEWLHRFREDDRSPTDPNLGLVFTKEDARNALSIADYVPGLLDNYIGASYRIPGRVDIRRFYEIGVFEDTDAVRRAYRDAGYSPESAEAYAKFVQLNSAKSKAKLAGELSPADVATQYRNNLLTKNEALQLLGTAGLTNEQAITTIEATDVKKRSASRATVVKSLRQRYFMGEFTDAEASQQLADTFMDLSQAADTVRLWNAERRAKQKSPTVAVLCKWYGRGQIDLIEFMRRVGNLNYSPTDALRIVESCQLDIQERRQKEITAELARQQKLQQAANKEAAKAIREARAAARALKLQHMFQRKVSTKVDTKGTTVTTTETVIDKPDDNITSTNQHIDVSGPNGQL